jgi:hypothetical protein
MLGIRKKQSKSGAISTLKGALRVQNHCVNLRPTRDWEFPCSASDSEVCGMLT